MNVNADEVKRLNNDGCSGFKESVQAARPAKKIGTDHCYDLVQPTYGIRLVCGFQLIENKTGYLLAKKRKTKGLQRPRQYQ